MSKKRKKAKRLNAISSSDSVEITPPQDLMSLLDLTIAQGPESLRLHAQTVRDHIEMGQHQPNMFTSMLSKGGGGGSTMVSTGGIVGINDYGVKGRRQYAAERRRLLDLYVIVLNNADIRTATFHLRNEIFRRGLELVPAFEYKCPECGTEYTKQQAEKAGNVCRECGSTEQLRTPDTKQVQHFEQVSKKTNYFNQNLESLLRETEDDINTVDDAFIYFRYEYSIDEDIYNLAQLDPFNDDYEPEKHIKMLFRLDPTLVEYDLDARGIPGMAHHQCIMHRDVLLDVPFDEGWDVEWKGRCASCGLRTYPIYFKYSEQQAGSFGARRPEVLYLFEWEVAHWSRYSECYDYLTEVLTKSSGWKRIADIDIEKDEVATLTPNGFLEWNKPLDKIIRQYSGPMWRAKGQRIDMVVTPNHKLWVRGLHPSQPQRNRGTRSVEFHEHDGFPRHHIDMKHPKLGEVNNGMEPPVNIQLTDTYGLVEAYRLDPHETIQMSNTAKWSGVDLEYFDLPGCDVIYKKYSNQPNRTIFSRQFPMNDWLEFLGYFLSEGNTVDPVKYPNHPVTITQSITVHPDNSKKIRDCIDRLGLPRDGDRDKINIRDWALRSYLLQFGKSRDKFIPEWIKNLPPKRLEHLFDALMLGDGHYDSQGRPHSYRSMSTRLRDDVAEIAIKLGYQVSFLQRRGQEVTGLRFGTKFNTSLELIRGTYGLSNDPIEPAAIFGLEVPNHIMMTRRNGKLVWGGNTETYGFSPVLSFYEKALTLIGMDRYLYDYFYERRVPQGVIAVFTDDVDGLRRTKDDVEAKMQRDPHYVPWLGVSAKTGQGKIDYVRFGYSLDELDYLPVRDEIRERIAAVYGVSQIWMSSTEGVGGLNSESVPSDTPIWIRKNRFIDCIPIGMLMQGKNIKRESFPDLEVLASDGWTRPLGVWRQMTDKPMFTFRTGEGLVRTTGKHSMIVENRGIVDADEVKEGDRFTKVNLPIADSSTEITDNEAWLLGFFAAEGHVSKNTVHFYNTNSALIDRAVESIRSVYGIEPKRYSYTNKKSTVPCEQVAIHDRLLVQRYIKESTASYQEHHTEWSSEEKRPIACHRNLSYKKVPSRILNADPSTQAMFLKGYQDGDAHIYANSIIAQDTVDYVLAAGLQYLYMRTGVQTATSFRETGKENQHPIYSLRTLLSDTHPRRNEAQTVCEIRQDNSWHDYVYDIETESGTFVAGLGFTVIHNSQQLVVMSRAVEGAQRSYHTHVFPYIEKAFNITDWHLRLKTPEETGELTEYQIKQTKATVAQTMVSMGFGADYDSDTDTFSYTGSIPAQSQMAEQMTQMANQNPWGQSGTGQPGTPSPKPNAPAVATNGMVNGKPKPPAPRG